MLTRIDENLMSVRKSPAVCNLDVGLETQSEAATLFRGYELVDYWKPDEGSPEKCNGHECETP